MGAFVTRGTKRLETPSVGTLGEVVSEESQCKVLPDGTKGWYFNGVRHRSDGPAIEWTDGHKEWWLNGKLHRTDGPAVEVADGTKEWYFNDEWLGLGDEGFWALWELLNEEERSDWKLLQWAPWMKS
jgi:hypothetical protein